ncbi:MAG: insulinase family protein [Phycisphaerales bacterium]
MKRGLLWLCALGAAAVPSALVCAQAPNEPKWSTPADRPSAASDLVVCREVRMSRKSGVYTFTYANGVRVHVRPVEGSGRVWVQALVFGPELTEAEGEKGITATAVWAGRTGERGAAATGVLRAGVTPEGITARWNGENTELGEGLEKLRQWIESPRVDAERLAQMKERRAGGGGSGLVAGPVAREGAVRPEGGAGGPSFERAAMGVIGEALAMGDGRGSRRGRPGGAEFTAQKCEEWLKEKLGSLPLEVAIVGDVTLAGAEKLAREQLGTLPVRGGGEPAGPQTLAEQRTLTRGDAPASVVKIVDATGTGAMLVIALPGPDMGDLAAARRARLASRVLDAMIGPALDVAGIEHKQQAVLSMPGRMYSGAGALHVHVRIAGGEAEATKAAEAVEALIAKIATDGAPEAVVQRAGEAAAKGAEQQETTAEYWPGVLLMCGVYRLDPEQIADAPRVYRAMTPADVAEALRPCVGKGRRVIVVPAPQRAPSAEPVAPAGVGAGQPTPGASPEP